MDIILCEAKVSIISACCLREGHTNQKQSVHCVALLRLMQEQILNEGGVSLDRWEVPKRQTSVYRMLNVLNTGDSLPSGEHVQG